jgi:prevent-host-death family protein
MSQLNVHAAKTQLSWLLERVCHGEEVVIARAGKPVARLVPYEAPLKKRPLGHLAGQIRVPRDFDEESPEIVAAFEADGETS